MSFPENDNEFQEMVVDHVTDEETGYVIRIGNQCTYIDKSYGVFVKTGDKIRIYGKGFGYTIRGIFINGKEVYYQTVEEFDRDLKERARERDEERIKRVQDLEQELIDNPPDEPFAWQPGMGEISGFGGGYEQCCRTMLQAGLQWLSRNPDIALRFKMYENVVGIAVAENDDSEVLNEVLMDAAGGDCTGAMHQAVVSHILWIQHHSWDEYVAKRKKFALEEKEYDDAVSK
jgi:hypothetical protein